MLTFQYQPDPTLAANQLAERLVTSLEQHDKVAWMVCGGSNIALAVVCMRQIPVELTSKLTIFLTDERYGIPGHADSNWQQLKEAGFDPGRATTIPTLEPDMTLSDTCTYYAKAVTRALDKADIVIAQFGIGGDGHIAGILPGSSAITDATMVAGYDAGAYTRITLTPLALRRISVAYAFVYGATKKEALERLRGQDLSLFDQPAQILKELPEAYVINDQLRDYQAVPKQEKS